MMAGGERDRLRDPQWPAVKRCAKLCPHKTPCNRLMEPIGCVQDFALSQDGPKPERVMIDATQLKAHRTAASLLKRGCSRPHRTHQRRAELQAAYRLRSGGRPIILKFSAAQRPQGCSHSARRVASRFPWDRRPWLPQCLVQALGDRGIIPCIPSSRSGKNPLLLQHGHLSQAPQGRDPVARLKDGRPRNLHRPNYQFLDR
jgi:hypothetical protein